MSGYLDSPEDVLKAVLMQGFTVRADGGTLRIGGQTDDLAEDFRNAIREHKAGMLAILGKRTIWQATPTGGWHLTHHPFKQVVAPGTVGVK